MFRKIYTTILSLLIVITIWKIFQNISTLPEKWDISDRPPKSVQVAEEAINKIKVSVYYEALCSDSRNFIIQQLVPTYNDLHNFIQLDLIPYGKAKTTEVNGEISFVCQHAATECLANKIHACGIDHIPDPLMQLRYIACMIDDNLIPREIGERCAQELRISYDPISDCVDSDKGTQLLKAYGIRTRAVTPAISFIPTVVLDDSQKVSLANTLKNLRKELCRLFPTKPKECL